MQKNKHPIIGTIIYIGKSQLNTVYGQMTAYSFQDLIHKGYIIALAHGDLNAKTLYTRLHSSCVTSQLMRSLDCDCKSQLNGAIKKICSGNGILFYLIQEGRGCGYVGKSRACMNVQYYETQRNINTFEAYEMLGMQHDYRQYNDVKDILKILKIDPEFILLTNNPDKIEKFTKLGIRLKCIQSIEVEPNAFNQAYLVSKQQYGHILYQAKTKVNKYQIPYPRIQPFTPYSMPNAERFVHVSSYYLPLKPVWNRVLLSPEQYDKVYKTNGIQKSYQIVRDPANKQAQSYYTQLTSQQIEQNAEILSKPNWFQINVHFDIVTHNDYLILKYGDCTEKGKVPIVRIHSQSLFNRFPLQDRQYSDRYKRTLDQIIRNGCGMLLIFYNDGRGSGFGYYVMNSSKPLQSSQVKIGVEADKRDYFGAINLLKCYLNPQNPIDILTGNSSYQKLSQQLAQNQVNVRRYIRLSNQSQRQGILSVEQRVRSIKNSVNFMIDNLDISALQTISNKITQNIKNNKKVYTTGIGSSQAHAKAAEQLFNGKLKYITPLNLDTLNADEDVLIVFSQNLSPNIISCIDQFEFKNLVFVSSLDSKMHTLNKKKGLFIENVKKNNALFLRYPPEIPDDTLVRVSGPFVVYCLIIILKQITEKQVKKEDFAQVFADFVKEFTKLNDALEDISDGFIQSLSQAKNLVICCDSSAMNLAINIRLKFIQSAMINTHITDYVNFAHGTFQFIQNSHNYCVWFITKKSNKYHAKTIQMLSSPQNKVHTSYYQDIKYLSLQLQLQANNCLMQLIQILKVNQCDWPGKGRQYILYQVYK